MKYLLSVLLFSLSSQAFAASQVISCGDAMNVGGEARIALHRLAQQRAQKEIEEFLGKKLIYPHINAMGEVGDEESMATSIEVFWCDSYESPLHDAYYSLYSRHKHLFEGEELPIEFP